MGKKNRPRKNKTSSAPTSRKHSTTTKVGNKKLNKAAKRGELRKQRLKEKKKELLKNLRNQENQKVLANDKEDENENIELEEEDSLDEEDAAYYAECDAQFVSSVMKGEVRRDRKRKRNIEDEDEDDVSRYEKIPRRFAEENGQKVKMLLPIKDEGRVVPRSMVMEDSDDDENDQSETLQKDVVTEDEVKEKNSKQKVLPALSEKELKVLTEKKLMEKKILIASLSSDVVKDPQENIDNLKKLRKLLGEQDPDVFYWVRLATMLSFFEIFKDIIPGYRLRLPTEQEKQQQMKKETKKLMEYESGLLKSYKIYLEFLEYTITENNAKLKSLGFSEVSMTPAQTKEFKMWALKCMCDLLKTHPDFNYRKEIVEFLVPLMTHKEEVGTTVCETMKSIFVADRTGHVTLEIVRAISKLVKTERFKCHPRVVEPLLSLNIEAINTEKGESSKKKKEDLRKLSRKDRKDKKKKKQMEKELNEMKASQDKEERLKINTEIVESVFTTFFRVLKQKKKSRLLSVVFEGLQKFTHLINVDFFKSLFDQFDALMESGNLTNMEILKCLQAAFCLWKKQGTTLMEYANLYAHLFRILARPPAESSAECPVAIVELMETCIINRRTEVLESHVLSFIKKLINVTHHQLPAAAGAYLAMAHRLVSIFLCSAVLYDQEEGSKGQNREGPDNWKAGSTIMKELSKLKNHDQPEVQRLANALLRRNSSGLGELSRMTPTEVFYHIRENNRKR